MNGENYACRFADIYFRDRNLYEPILEKLKTSFKSHVKGIVHMQNITGFMRPQAISLSERVTITNIMPGQTMKYWLENYNEFSKINIPDKHIQGLFGLLKNSLMANIYLDMTKPDNVFYDAKLGFGIVDYMDFPQDKRDLGALLFATMNNILVPKDDKSYAVLCPYFAELLKRAQEISNIYHDSQFDDLWAELVRKNEMRLQYGAGYDQPCPY